MNIFESFISNSETGKQFLREIQKIEYISTAPSDSDHSFEFRESSIETAGLITSLIKAKGRLCFWNVGTSVFKDACWTIENAIVEYLAEQHNNTYCFPSDNFAKLSEAVKSQFAGSDAICHNIKIIESFGWAEGNQLLLKVEYSDDYMYIENAQEEFELLSLFKSFCELELSRLSD